jgi:hypothetical protein
LLAVTILAALPGIPRLKDPAAAAQHGSSEEELNLSKKELLKRLERLQAKLPPELARKLIVLSMKIATGWCSPSEAQELAGEIDKLPPGERKKFEKEWGLVQEHEAWPRQPRHEKKKDSAAQAK